jgi:hypothetical protein
MGTTSSEHNTNEHDEQEWVPQYLTLYMYFVSLLPRQVERHALSHWLARPQWPDHFQLGVQADFTTSTLTSVTFSDYSTFFRSLCV